MPIGQITRRKAQFIGTGDPSPTGVRAINDRPYRGLWHGRRGTGDPSPTGVWAGRLPALQTYMLRSMI